MGIHSDNSATLYLISHQNINNNDYIINDVNHVLLCFPAMGWSPPPLGPDRLRGGSVFDTQWKGHLGSQRRTTEQITVGLINLESGGSVPNETQNHTGAFKYTRKHTVYLSYNQQYLPICYAYLWMRSEISKIRAIPELKWKHLYAHTHTDQNNAYMCGRKCPLGVQLIYTQEFIAVVVIDTVITIKMTTNNNHKTTIDAVSTAVFLILPLFCHRHHPSRQHHYSYCLLLSVDDVIRPQYRDAFPTFVAAGGTVIWANIGKFAR